MSSEAGGLRSTRKMAETHTQRSNEPVEKIGGAVKMESLKDILQRITQKTPEQREKSALLTCEVSLPQCPKCKDVGFLERRDLVPGEKDFGDVVLCQCRQTQEYVAQRNLAFIRLPNQSAPKTFSNFQINERVGQPMMQSYHAAKGFADGSEGNPILVFQGPHGTGKSHLLEAIGRDMLDQNYTALYAFVPDWLQALKDTFDKKGEESYQEVWNMYSSVPVLLLDDLGAEKVTDWTKGELTRLIDYRHRNDLLTVITTNDDEDTTVRKQGDRLADRLFDTNTGKVQVIYNNAPSYRTGRTWDQK
jgi:DNA replication protein DnaC